MTTGAITLLLHCTIMWTQIIDEIFWPIAIKAVAERLNSLQINLKGRTPKSILHGFEVIYILVKSYHTLFCPIYALDARLQSVGGARPSKWEIRLRIGVQIGNSLFHAGRVALVCNPTTGRVSHQYHVVFNDDL